MDEVMKLILLSGKRVNLEHTCSVDLEHTFSINLQHTSSINLQDISSVQSDAVCRIKKPTFRPFGARSHWKYTVLPFPALASSLF